MAHTFRNRATRAVLTLALIGVIFPLKAADASKESSASADASVVSVIDGDTIKVSVGGRVETVRLVGVDTPETKKPGTPVQCYGPEATQATSRIVSGARVKLTADRVAGDRDKWGRLLRYVSVGGRDLGESLLRSGLARAYAYKNQNYAKRAAYEKIQSRARISRTGLWGAC